MYAQLNDEKNSKASDASNSGESPNSKLKLGLKSNGSKGIKKNSELRKSLIGDNSVKKYHNGSDQDHADLEIGNGFDNHNSANGALMDSDDDPFYVFKEDLLIKLEMLDDGLERFDLIVQNTDTAVNTHEVKEAKKQLKRHIKNAESALKDLQTTVRLVENKRENFLNISDSELFHRKNFISASLDRIKNVRTQMTAERIKSKLLADEKAKSKRRLGLLGAKSEDMDEETEFIANTHASTQLMMQQQDETLDELDGAVVRVQHISENIHEELGHQNKMLNDLEDDLTNAEEQLGLVMGKLAKVLKTKSKWQLGIILIMSLIVIILFFLVVYT